MSRSLGGYGSQARRTSRLMFARKCDAMIEEHMIYAVRKSGRTRKAWMCPSGQIGTVEEVAREYYVTTRGFNDCLIDTACVYGGLAWLLLHDILFHDNLNSQQPLCSLYLHTPQRFYERHRDMIESRLDEYKADRGGVFTRQMQRFRNHPFFCDPQSRIAPHSGAWLIRNDSALRDFVVMSVDHGQEALVREIILTGTKGRNAGWPDLVAWSTHTLVFAEVKSTDSLSGAQLRWMANHQRAFRIELIHVLDGGHAIGAGAPQHDG